MNFFHTFRFRLLSILAILLVATLTVQYYLNLKTELDNANLREMQERALVAGIALGANSLTSGVRLADFVKREGQPFFDEKSTKRINDIFVIDDDLDVYDTLSGNYPPTDSADGSRTIYVALKDVENLPPLMNRERLGEDRERFPNPSEEAAQNSDGEAHAVPLETNQGRYYVMVILRADKSAAARRAAQPLVYTLLLLLTSIIITAFLVRRFTKPLADLSEAARRVAAGDLSVRTPDTNRHDEIAQLAARFNEMTAQLEKKEELEAQLQQAEKTAVLGRLGSAIAHEIRNPLNYINLTLDHLRAKFAPEETDKRRDFEKLTAQLKAEVARINQQITDFLQYSRPLRLDFQSIDARRAVENSLRLVEGQAAEQEVKISLVESERVPQILGDAEYLRSVFSNLFINALQAMEGGAGNMTVKISAETGEDFVTVEVSDTGAGIPAENLPKIFEPYFSTKETGTGLGLAIVKKIVDDHGGTIQAESAPGEGTKFTVKLPVGVRNEG